MKLSRVQDSSVLLTAYVIFSPGLRRWRTRELVAALHRSGVLR